MKKVIHISKEMAWMVDNGIKYVRSDRTTEALKATADLNKYKRRYGIKLEYPKIPKFCEFEVIYE